jgi:hypothetical protein
VSTRRGSPAHAAAHLSGIAARLSGGFISAASGIFVSPRSLANDATDKGGSAGSAVDSPDKPGPSTAQTGSDLELTMMSQVTVAITRSLSVAAFVQARPFVDRILLPNTGTLCSASSPYLCLCQILLIGIASAGARVLRAQD